MKLSHLKSNPKNSRKITLAAMEKLKKSIKKDPEFMTLRPIIYDTDLENLIIGGNQRHRACVELGYIEIPKNWAIPVKGLSKKKRERFILIDNSPDAISGDWDFNSLANFFDIEALTDFGLDKYLKNNEVDEIIEKIENEEEWLEAHDRVEKRAEKIHKKIEALVEENPLIFDKGRVVFISPKDSKCLIIVDDNLKDFIIEVESHKGEDSPLNQILDKAFEL